ncbi:MAG: hypothetical protein H8F28_22750 [Fibrella sp.]|nr:hypothetical protein [Armatimonadota bacterium]
MAGVPRETSAPDNSFALEDSGISFSERQAANAVTPIPTETDGVGSSFPLENPDIIGTDPNERRSLPLESSGVTMADSAGIE